jgi:flagellar biogenesis protein FliO
MSAKREEEEEEEEEVLFFMFFFFHVLALVLSLTYSLILSFSSSLRNAFPAQKKTFQSTSVRLTPKENIQSQ